MTLWQTTFVLTALTYGAAVANAAIAPRMAVGLAAPDLLAALAMAWVAVGRRDRRFVAAAAIGLVSDLCGGQRLGIGMGCYLLAGSALETAYLKLAYHPPSFRVATAVPAVIGLHLLLACGQWLESGMSVPIAAISAQALGMGVYSAAICLLALVMLAWSPRQQQFS